MSYHHYVSITATSYEGLERLNTGYLYERVDTNPSHMHWVSYETAMAMMENLSKVCGESIKVSINPFDTTIVTKEVNYWWD